MKKTLMMIGALAMTLSAIAAEEQDLTVADFTISAGETKTLTLDMNNTKGMTAFQCDMYFPEGLTFGKLGAFDKTRIEYDEETEEYSHQKGAAVQGDGAVRFLVTPAVGTLNVIKGTSGAVLKFTVVASSTFNSSSPCTITIKHKELADPAGGQHNPADSETSVNAATALSSVEAPQSAQPAVVKAVENGRLVVKTAGGTYTTAGARVK